MASCLWCLYHEQHEILATTDIFCCTVCMQKIMLAWGVTAQDVVGKVQLVASSTPKECVCHSASNVGFIIPMCAEHGTVARDQK